MGQLRLILEHLQTEFVSTGGPQIAPKSAESLLRLLDEDLDFSQKVLAPEPMLVFLDGLRTSFLRRLLQALFVG